MYYLYYCIVSLNKEVNWGKLELPELEFVWGQEELLYKTQTMAR